MKRRYEVVAPDGTVHTRTSERVYEYAVVGKTGFGNNPEGWRLCGFCGDAAKAEKLRRKMLGATWGWREAVVVAASVE